MCLKASATMDVPREPSRIDLFCVLSCVVGTAVALQADVPILAPMCASLLELPAAEVGTFVGAIQVRYGRSRLKSHTLHRNGSLAWFEASDLVLPGVGVLLSRPVRLGLLGGRTLRRARPPPAAHFGHDRLRARHFRLWPRSERPRRRRPSFHDGPPRAEPGGCQGSACRHVARRAARTARRALRHARGMLLGRARAQHGADGLACLVAPHRRREAPVPHGHGRRVAPNLCRRRHHRLLPHRERADRQAPRRAHREARALQVPYQHLSNIFRA